MPLHPQAWVGLAQGAEGLWPDGGMVSTTEQLGVIADDFTGAMDTGVVFAAAGFPTQFRRAGRLPDSLVRTLVVSTDSREAQAEVAAAQVRLVAARMAGRRLFKKIDSTLRGHIGVEIDALLTAAGIERAVICPAAPDVGRTVQGGLIYVHGDALHETAFARDPHWPAATSRLTELVRYEPVTHLDLAVVRAGVPALTRAVQNAPSRLVTIDAIDDNDLVVIAQTALAGDFLPCGSKGLAAAWAQALGGQTPAQEPPDWTPIAQKRVPLLIIAGSRHPATDRQLSNLARHQDAVIVTVEPGLDLRGMQRQMIDSLAQHPVVILRTAAERLDSQTLREVNEDLSGLTRAACETASPAGLMLIGGETAGHVCGRLAVEGIQILGEIEPGVPFGQVIGGPVDALPVITKAGGFGTDDTLIAVVRWFQRNEAASE